MPDYSWTFKLDDKYHVVLVTVGNVLGKTTIRLDGQVVAEKGGKLGIKELNVPFLVNGVPSEVDWIVNGLSLEVFLRVNGVPIMEPNQVVSTKNEQKPTTSTDDGSDMMAKLQEAKDMLDSGLIDEEEFKALKAKIISGD